MLAMNFRGPYRVRADHKPEPAIEHPNDAIVRVTRSCICGSDLHLYHGLVPDTRVGTTFGHEFVGVVAEIGPSVRTLKVGEHVLVPFNVFCGSCYFCQKELYGNCHNTNPSASAVGGIYGYSHTAGGYDGGQAEYVRVPMADVGPTVIPDGLDPDDAVLLTDACPTGYQGAEMGDIDEGDTVVVFGAGPVGIFAQGATGGSVGRLSHLLEQAGQLYQDRADPSRRGPATHRRPLTSRQEPSWNRYATTNNPNRRAITAPTMSRPPRRARCRTRTTCPAGAPTWITPTGPPTRWSARRRGSTACTGRRRRISR